MLSISKLIKACSKICGSNAKLAKYLQTSERNIYRWNNNGIAPKAASIIKMYELVHKNYAKL